MYILPVSHCCWLIFTKLKHLRISLKTMTEVDQQENKALCEATKVPDNM